jgi:hypothetical protein
MRCQAWVIAAAQGRVAATFQRRRWPPHRATGAGRSGRRGSGGGQGKHWVGQEGPAGRVGDLGRNVDGQVPSGRPAPERRPSSQSATEMTGFRCALETGPALR